MVYNKMLDRWEGWGGGEGGRRQNVILVHCISEVTE